jgi:hypothetical protein
MVTTGPTYPMNSQVEQQSASPLGGGVHALSALLRWGVRECRAVQPPLLVRA